jgi:hypothetical protein
MNIINKIVGKDIGSIIYKYLTISKDEVKINHLKLCGYLKNAKYYEIEFKPSKMKIDSIEIYEYYEWKTPIWIRLKLEI